MTNWLSPTTMHSLGWTLVHFLWQGTAAAALAAATMALCRRASVRYVIGVSALLLMLAAPVATLLLLTQSGSSSAEKPSARVARLQALPSVAGARFFAPVPPSTSRPDAFLWLVAACLVSVAFVSLGTAGGFLLLELQPGKRS